ncbi:MAG TPA: hypothetical protein VKN99_21510 [Polyangia bacterium]|nr:hypothetical protein [Polyangia bacterium]
MVLIALAIAGLVLPPMFVYAALRRHHGVIAVLLALGWVLYIGWIGRKLFSAKAPPSDEDGPS